MEESPISTPILYLDCIILASVIYPAGLSNSLFVTWKGAVREVSTGWLAALALPYAAVVPTIWALSPKLFASSLLNPMFTLQSTKSLYLLGLAVFLAPVVLAIEYGILGFVSYRVSGIFPRRIAVQRFWRKGLSPTGHLLLVLVAAGEEIFYRLICLGVLVSMDLPLSFALAISSFAFGLNHLFLGRTVVVSKSVAGLLYGALYIGGGGNIWLPIVTHALQNLVLFRLTKRSDA